MQLELMLIKACQNGQKGIVDVYEDRVCDDYTQLEAIFSWGFSVVEYIDVMEPLHHLYDNSYQYMTTIYYNDDNYKSTIIDGVLISKWKGELRYKYDLTKQAPIHSKDVRCILRKEGINNMHEHIIITNNKVYYLVYMDGCSDITRLLSVEDAISVAISKGFVLIEDVETKRLIIDEANGDLITNYCTSGNTPFGDLNATK